jgi:hypothetical protein
VGVSLDVTVAVATFGDDWWRSLAQARAIPSAERLGVPVVHVHADSLHEARNAALALVDTEHVVHLDADDELEPGFFEAMGKGTADVRVPSVRYVRGLGYQPPPVMPRVAGHRHACAAECLTQGNWIVVGACVRADLIRQVGGWRDFPWSEDWDTWLRCHLADASFEAVPQAVYRAHVRRDSRNRSASAAQRLAAHRAIEAANGLLPGGARA